MKIFTNEMELPEILNRSSYRATNFHKFPSMRKKILWYGQAYGWMFSCFVINLRNFRYGFKYLRDQI